MIANSQVIWEYRKIVLRYQPLIKINPVVALNLALIFIKPLAIKGRLPN